MGFFDSERVKNSKSIQSELVQCVRPRRDDTFAVAAGIVANYAEMLQKLRHQRIEYMQIGAKRMRQHQHGGAFVSFDQDVERFVFDHHFGHA